jgi:hypothetical protein
MAVRAADLSKRGADLRARPRQGAIFRSLQQNLLNAQLTLYPDASHGSFYQYPVLFVSQADHFFTSALQGDDANLRPSERLSFPSVVPAAGI